MDAAVRAFLERGYTEIDQILEYSDSQPGSTLGGLGLGLGGGNCIGNAPAMHQPPPGTTA